MRLRRVLVLTGLAIAVVAGPVGATPARAWPLPYVSVEEPTCTADGYRNPILITVTNLETQFPRSPMTIEAVHLSVPWPITKPFTAEPLENTGTASGTAEMTIANPWWTGTVFIDIRARYSGLDGDHVVNGTGEVHVTSCRVVGVPQPCATPAVA